MTFYSSLRSSKLLTYLLLLVVAGVAALLLSTTLAGDRLSWRSQSLPKAGGSTTINNRSSRAFGNPAPGLTPQEMDLHTAGDIAFDDVFVTAPATVNPGLGPLFNNSSCSGCHVGNGRGLPQLGQALVRVSLPVSPGQTIAPEAGVVPVPQIGTQLRDHAVYGQLPEAKIELSWREGAGQYPDGGSYRLRSPQLLIRQADPNKPIPDTLLTSLRIPPPVFGDGLLEAIPEKTLAQWADPTDQNSDGISGRINRVWDPERQGFTLGRFGLKASSPNLRHQTASAYVHDMGVSNPLFPDRSGTGESQTPQVGAEIGTEISTEISDRTLQSATFYTQTLGVPARTQLDDPTIETGEKLFIQANCAACHLPTIKTGSSPIPALAHQTIHPYTDLLLHDLGLGLADHRPDFDATGQEWRTPPLWGLGLTQTVLPYAGYLHDGRARSIEEAILWHGGEAEASKAQFMAMEVGDRQALLSFLNSL
ncbi:MAG: c-type cytochrome [Synechococcales cyanobacterium RU_4_20]|nr:c-type cytochrome [Synechococcales cyanobacterium RU_4_20]NJR69266.1 c-type cytochrome [Synechococcales cyanobacterium CRU_2_2]